MSAAAAGGAARPVPPGAYGSLLTIYLVWGASYLLVKVCLTGSALITPLQLQLGRAALAAAMLAGIALARAGMPRGVSPRTLALCAASGALLWVGGNGMATLAAPHAASGFIVMAMGAIPLWTCLLDLLVARRAPSGRTVLALGLGLGGLATVLLPPLLSGAREAIRPGYEALAVGLLLGGGVSWALGTVLQRPLAGRLDPAWAATFQMLSAAVILAPVVASAGAPAPWPPDVAQAASFLALTLFASVAGMLAYLRVVRNFSPAIASTFAYVNPVLGVLLGWAVLGERPSGLALLGMAVVLGSIATILSARR